MNEHRKPRDEQRTDNLTAEGDRPQQNTNARQRRLSASTVSRRDVMKALGAAGVGAGALGSGASTATVAAQGSVGQTLAGAISGIDPSSYLIFGPLAVGYDTIFGTDDAPEQRDPQDVSAEVTKQDVFSTVQSASLAQKSALERIAQTRGVKPDGSRVANLDATPFASSLTETLTATVAKQYSQDAALNEAVQAAQKQMRLDFLRSEYNIFAMYNDWALAIAPALTYAVENYTTTDYEIDVENLGTGYIKLQTLETATSIPEDGKSVVWSLSLDDTGVYTVSTDELSSEQKPANGMRVVGLTYVDASSDSLGVLHPIAKADKTYFDPNMPVKVFSPDNITVKNPATGNDKTYDLSLYGEVISAGRDIKQSVETQAETITQTLFEQLSRDDVTVEDVLSPRQIYRELNPSNDVTRAMMTARSLGYGLAGDAIVTISTPKTAEGWMFARLADGVDKLVITDDTEANPSAVSTIPAKKYDTIRVVDPDADGSGVTTVTSGDVTVDTISGAETLTFNDAPRMGPQGYDADKAAERIKERRESLDRLEELISELDSDPAGGGAAGGSGDGPSLGVLGVGAAALGGLYALTQNDSDE